MAGGEGSYIKFSDTYDPSIRFDALKGPEFRLSKGLSPGLREVAKAVSGMASQAMSLRAFIEVQSARQYGLVNHALCAGLRRWVLKDYMMLLTRLEYGLYNEKEFSVKRFAMLCNPMTKRIRQAYELSQLILKENIRKSEMAANSYSDLDKVIESLKIGGDAARLDELGIGGSISTVCKGGTILRILAQRLAEFKGDPDARELLTNLLTDASRPYLTMLQQWIHKGVIEDPYDEFLIREQKSIKREELDMDYTDEYWEKRYTVRKDDLPLELSSSQVHERILLTGKYLNVVRECGGIDASHEVTEEYTSISDTRILQALASAYHHANRSLLSLLITTHDLPARLKSLKHYFFLDQADFFPNFIDIAEKELAKPVNKGSKAKLQYLLDMALRQPGSSSSNDPFKEDVYIELVNTSVTDYLLKIVNVTGMDPNDPMGGGEGTSEKAHGGSSSRLSVMQGIQLDFKVPFPLSLVLSRKTIMRYQLLFRHLVEMKHIERTLNNAWADFNKSPEWYETSNIPEVEAWKIKTSKLRTKMFLFIQQMLYYSTLEVIEPNWSKFQDKLHDAPTADILMDQHVYFLDTCMKECMLTNEKLLKLQNRLFTACRLFGEYLPTRGKHTLQVLTRQKGVKRPVSSRSGEEVGDLELFKKMESAVAQYENSFEHHLKVLMGALNYYAATETTGLLSLCAQLEVAVTGL